jgi:hypothetical protein
MSKVYTCQLKDKSGITHIYMRGTFTDVTDSIITYPTDDVPLFVEERKSHGNYFLHFILV